MGSTKQDKKTMKLGNNTIHHFWISCHRPCLCHPSIPPTQNCLSTVFNVSCNHCTTREKLQRMAMYFFSGGGGVGEGEKARLAFPECYYLTGASGHCVIPTLQSSHLQFSWQIVQDTEPIRLLKTPVHIL